MWHTKCLQVDYDGERKKVRCGTLQYIAPEVFGKNGYSYEVNIIYVDFLHELRKFCIVYYFS